MVGCVQERLHLGPLGQKRLPHLISQPGQGAELGLERQLVLPVHVIQITGPAAFAERFRQLLGPDVPGLDPVVLEQLVLREGFEGSQQRRDRRLEMMVHVGPASRMRE